jgi:hypothetical protein
MSGGYLYDSKVVEHLMNCGDEVSIISLNERGLAGKVTDNFSPAL